MLLTRIEQKLRDCRKGLPVLILLLQFQGASCSVKPAEPGLCSLNCGNAVVANNDVVMQPANDPVDFICRKGLQAPEDLDQPVQVQFKIYNKVVDDDREIQEPVPFASIEPVVTGIMAEVFGEGNVEQDAEGNYVPEKFLGILTPKSNWCSDACGVVSLEILPRCLTAGQTNDVSVQIRTGSAYSQSYKFSIESPEDDAL